MKSADTCHFDQEWRLLPSFPRENYGAHVYISLRQGSCTNKKGSERYGFASHRQSNYGELMMDGLAI
ncbi:hypothetical protein SUGI_0733020 [Cryptomeria japonica]|nr:hypothetical protein SUGI_0733020 [Cryptomeria japonica]